MKKLVIILSIITIISCNKDKPQTDSNLIILKGVVENPKIDSVNILSYGFEKIKSFPVKNGQFRDTLDQKEGYYVFSSGNVEKLLYLHPKLDFDILVDKNDSLSFSGFGAKENQYLIDKNKFNRKLPKDGPIITAHLNEKKFLNLVNTNHAKRVSFLKKYTDLDTHFKFLEEKYNELIILSKYAFYEGNVKSTKNDSTFKVSSNFPKAFEKIELNNEKLLVHFNYLVLLHGYFKKLADEELKKNEHLDKVLTVLKMVDNKITNDKVKQELTYFITKWDLKTSNQVDSTYNKFTSIVKNEKYLKRIEHDYLTLKQVKRGDTSPSFAFNDINEKTITLEDFKGKYVYLDIWNTYCAPCIVEMPRFEALKEQFKDKNIAFVSICVNSKKETWKKMIKDKKLSDFQLFTPTDKTGFFKKYLVVSAPRYVLIDPNGKVVNAYAKRPSDNKLIKQLESLLK